MCAKIKEYSDDDHRKPSTTDSVIVVQHRSHACQCCVGHEDETKDRPESRVEGGTEPAGHERNDD